jgi:hypothetical protein
VQSQPSTIMPAPWSELFEESVGGEVTKDARKEPDVVFLNF